MAVMVGIIRVFTCDSRASLRFAMTQAPNDIKERFGWACAHRDRTFAQCSEEKANSLLVNTHLLCDPEPLEKGPAKHL